ncbi:MULTISPECIES: P-loop ATPase, Sll1717 family [unclassified Modestobacter]
MAGFHAASASQTEGTKAIVRLADKGMTVGDVDLGGFDAESDHGLTNHFVRTPIVKRIFGPRKYLILGRKGSGKSALFRELPKLATQEAGSVVVLSLTPDAYAWGALRSYQEQGLSGEHAHANAWKLTLVVEMAARLTAAGMTWHESVYAHAATLSSFIKANFDDGSDLRVARSLYKGIESFDLSALGLGVGVTRGRRDPATAPVTPAVTEALLGHIKALLKDVRLIVQLDRLDDAWQGKAEDRTLIAGLLRAVKDLNDSFAAVELNSKVIVFLRSDIYDSLSFDDSDKHRQGELRIVWTAGSLRDLVNARLPDEVTVDELLQQESMRGGTTPFDYILRRTFYRPREVLQYLQLALDEAGDLEEQVWIVDITNSEPQFSAWKVADLKQEYEKAVPELASLIDALQQQTTPLDSVDDLEAVLTDRVPAIVSEKTARWCSSALWDASVIGARLNGTGAVRFRSTDPNFSMPTDGVVYVHFGLMKGLNVKERRKSKEA